MRLVSAPSSSLKATKPSRAAPLRHVPSSSAHHRVQTFDSVKPWADVFGSTVKGSARVEGGGRERYCAASLEIDAAERRLSLWRRDFRRQGQVAMREKHGLQVRRRLGLSTVARPEGGAGSNGLIARLGHGRLVLGILGISTGRTRVRRWICGEKVDGQIWICEDVQLLCEDG
ncbi:hypothetical protein M0R45_026218 [Rubus argutus]|uniref:Uncharacterized protein n=1 Tax=Rubus argutus TaxID=59490 RepID=A0AAW1WYJ3_RUBAR